MSNANWLAAGIGFPCDRIDYIQHRAKLFKKAGEGEGELPGTTIPPQRRGQISFINKNKRQWKVSSDQSLKTSFTLSTMDWWYPLPLKRGFVVPNGRFCHKENAALGAVDQADGQDLVTKGYIVIMPIVSDEASKEIGNYTRVDKTGEA